MPYRFLVFLFLFVTTHPLGAQALDWSTSLVPPQGPLPIRLAQAQELSDGSVLLTGEGDAAFLTTERLRVRVVSRIGADSNVLWTTDLGALPFAATGMASAVAELEGGALIVAFGRSLVAIERDTGTVLWETELQAYIRSFAVAPNGNFYAVGQTSEFPGFPYASLVSGSDGRTLWTRAISSQFPLITYSKAMKFSNGDLLAVVNKGGLVRLSSVDGTLIWQSEEPRNSHAPRVEIDELDRVVLFHGGSDGGLELRAGNDGTLIWQLSEAQTLQGHSTSALLLGARGDVFTVSYIEGESIQTYVRSFRLDNGNELWRIFASEAAEGPRFPRRVRLSPDGQRIAVLLSHSMFTIPEQDGPAGRRIQLFNSNTGTFTSGTDLPSGSAAQFADELTWTDPLGLSLAGIRPAASGQPALLLTRFDHVAATLGASAVVEVASGYAEFPAGGFALPDGGSVVLSRRGGTAQVFALTRLDAQGEQLWRTEHLPQTGTDWYWVGAKQADETSLVAVFARSQAQAGQILRVDIQTGQILYVRPVDSTLAGPFRPSLFEVDTSRSMILIGGTTPRGAVVSWHHTATGQWDWSGGIASNDFNTSWATIKRIQLLNDGGVLVLSRVFASESTFADMLHRFESNGLRRWMRSVGTSMAVLDTVLVDESAGEARVYGRSGPTPFFVRESTVSLTDGATLSTQSLECTGHGATSSGWVSRLGQQVVHLMHCPDQNGDAYRMLTRATWSAAPSPAAVLGLPAATQISHIAAGSEGRWNLSLGSAAAGAIPSVARLDLATARISGITPLRTSTGQPFFASHLIGSGGTSIVVGRHQEFDRPRVVVGMSRDTALFADGFEN